MDMTGHNSNELTYNAKFRQLIAPALAGVLVLAGCQTVPVGKSLKEACAAIDTAHAAFVVIASTGDLKPSLVAKENAAYAGMQQICATPDDATAASVLVRAANAYAVIAAALKEASKQ